MKRRKIKGTIIWTVLCLVIAVYFGKGVDEITIYPYISMWFIWGIPMLYVWREIFY